MKKIVLLLYVFKSVFSYTPIITVEQGDLLGTDYILPNRKVVKAFLGIPYADPPLNEYRFQSAPKSKPWKGVYNASFHRNSCLQIQMVNSNNSVLGSEDCLYLNIYTPELSTKDKNVSLDVFVYIHGGAFQLGTGNVYPDLFLETKDIVFVSINYRLGIFGFFCLNDTAAPGNYGLKDQHLALKWIKKNIHNFGGNPKSITLAGTSAGGACVDFHMIHSVEEDLFHKAMSFSGSATVPWAIRRELGEKCRLLAADVRCAFNDAARIVKCLREKSEVELLELQGGMLAMKKHPLLFGPVIEVNHPDAFITGDPLFLLQNGKVKDVPWISTMVKDEGLLTVTAFLNSGQHFETLDAQWNKLAPTIFEYQNRFHEVDREILSNHLREKYFGKKKISRETAKELIEIFNDGFFYNGIIDSCYLHNMAIQSKVYLLKFNYRGERSWTDVISKTKENYGVCHGDDIQYFIKRDPLDNLKTESDKAVSALMISIITNFMETGNPNKIVPQWEPLEKDLVPNISCLNIYSDKKVKLEKINIDNPKRGVWTEIFSQVIPD